MSAQGSFTQIGKYPVVRKLGEGATSEVYLCNDPFNLRDVAIKVAFPESLADPARGKMYRKLFLTEASPESSSTPTSARCTTRSPRRTSTIS
jgi:serine/threonine protein kinase